MLIFELIAQKKYKDAFDELKKFQEKKVASYKDLKKIYEQIISSKFEDDKKNEVIDSYLNFLYVEKDFSEICKRIEIFPKTKKNYLIILEALRDQGLVELYQNFYIEFLEYLRMKTLYEEIKLHTTDIEFNSETIDIIGFIISCLTIDAKSAIEKYTQINKKMVNGNYYGQANYNLVTSIYQVIESVKGINSDIDLIIDKLLLIKRFLEIRNLSKIRKKDFELFIEILLQEDNIDNELMIMKFLYEAERKNLCFEVARYVERKKEFNYLEEIRKDSVIKEIFIEFRQYQTGINKLINKKIENDITREFKFEIPNKVETKKYDYKELINSYLIGEETYDSVQDDLINQIKMNAFKQKNINDLLVSFEMIGFSKVIEFILERTEYMVNSYFKANHYFIKNEYYKCIEICDLEILTLDKNTEEYLAFLYLKGSSLKKINRIKEAIQILSLIKRIKKGFRNTEQLLNECKSS